MVVVMMMIIRMVIVLVLQTLQCQCFQQIFSSHHLITSALYFWV
jgi:hypothetical protein